MAGKGHDFKEIIPGPTQVVQGAVAQIVEAEVIDAGIFESSFPGPLKFIGCVQILGTLMKIDTLQCEEIVIKGSYATTSETGCTRSSPSCNGAWNRRESHIPRRTGPGGFRFPDRSAGGEDGDEGGGVGVYGYAYPPSKHEWVPGALQIHAMSADRLRDWLQSEVPEAWAPVSKSVQVDRLRGGSLSAGIGSVYSFESIEGRDCEDVGGV